MIHTVPLTLMVADDLPMIGESLAALCENITGCSVVAVCSDGEEAWQALRDLAPSIALLDWGLSEVQTMDLIRRCKAADIHTRIVVVAVKPDRRVVIEALRNGAHAFVLKSGTSRQLEEAFRQIMQGGVYLSPQIELQTLVEPERLEPSADPLSTLSSREQQVFTMLIEGIRAKEIAARLQLSPKTVDTYRASLMRKLNIHDVAGLVKFAIRRNLTALEARATA